VTKHHRRRDCLTRDPAARDWLVGTALLVERPSLLVYFRCFYEYAVSVMPFVTVPDALDAVTARSSDCGTAAGGKFTLHTLFGKTLSRFFWTG
jgi:hypothetical protein